MESGEEGLTGANYGPTPSLDHAHSSNFLTANFFLRDVGKVVLAHTANGFSWKSIEPLKNGEGEIPCFGTKLVWEKEHDVKFADVYAVELINKSLIDKTTVAHPGGSLFYHSSEMHWFRVHAVHKAKTQASHWIPSIYTLGNKNLEICKIWVNLIKAHLNMDVKRPKNLLVFVHPRSGKKHGCGIWEAVAPLFSQAGVKTKVLVTESAGHACNMLASMPNKDIGLYDGCIAVGGDGFFNEILNGVLLSRHKSPYPPSPRALMRSSGSSSKVSHHDAKPAISEPYDTREDESPLLTSLEHVTQSSYHEEDPEFHFPNERFRFGIIPAGSTDAIVICTTGTRDPTTSALHIILGKRVRLDIAQVVRWRKTQSSNEEPSVRYAASFAGYGFYGDVITESEKYRWMGPKRYDFAGTKVFLKHRIYEAEVNYLEVESEKGSSIPAAAAVDSTPRLSILPRKRDRENCRANCTVCNSMSSSQSKTESPDQPLNFEGLRWSSSKGRFISVGAAIISCQNEKAPDGLVADAHLSDGFLHLILIKDCPRPNYLWHLIQIARRGGDPLDFPFVEHHKTRAFTFKSFGTEGVWNVDGEIFPAHELSAQVFRGLVSLFATGPEA